MNSIEKAFKENTEITRDRDGTYNIDCKKGLWGVSGAIYPKVMNEAKHYFQQYYSDGEYDSTQLEKLKERADALAEKLGIDEDKI